VLILAGDSDSNLGDRAIVLGTCHALRQRLPDVQITLLSSAPEAASRYFGARAIPRGLLGFFSALGAARRADLVLVGGGGLFQDDDSLIKMPYWGLRVACVRLFARRIVGYSIGAGPLRSKLGRWSARLALACMERISVRDENARACLQPLTSTPIELVPDPALLLARHAPDTNLPAAMPADDGTPLIGVALRQWFHNVNSFIPHKYAVKYRLRAIPGEAQRQQLAELLAQVLDRVAAETGARILFLPTYNVAHEADDRFCEAVRERMQTSAAQLLHIDEPLTYLTVARRLRVMIGGRMHPTILAASVGVPVVGLAYNPKFFGFFRLLGFEDAVFSIDRFVAENQVEAMVDTVLKAFSTPPEVNDPVAQLQQQLDAFNNNLCASFAKPSEPVAKEY
jgi:polysaccharide pyruvyl transferase CsaB